MYATFDRNSPQNLSAEIHSLSWKGDARQGWLAAGNSRKTVGVTFTELLNDLEEDCGGGAQNGGDEETEPAVPLVGTAASPEISLERQGMRRNFNFREHSAEVSPMRAASQYLRVARLTAVPARPQAWFSFELLLSWLETSRSPVRSCFAAVY